MKRTIIIAIAVLSAPAKGEPARDDIVDTDPLAVAAHGMSLGYEHRMSSSWSLGGTVGLRGAALGDYTSTTWVGAVDGRYWKRRPMVGPFVGLHASAGRTTLAMSATGADLGVSWGFEQRVDFGWRFTIRDRLAITPSIGLGAHEDVDHVLAPSVHPVLGLGCELGFLF